MHSYSREKLCEIIQLSRYNWWKLWRANKINTAVLRSHTCWQKLKIRSSPRLWARLIRNNQFTYLRQLSCHSTLTKGFYSFKGLSSTPRHLWIPQRPGCSCKNGNSGENTNLVCLQWKVVFPIRSVTSKLYFFMFFQCLLIGMWEYKWAERPEW